MNNKFLFIGLGNIGLPIANRISKLKFKNFFVYDVNKKIKNKATKNNKYLKSLNNLSYDFDIIFTCLPNSKSVKLIYNNITKKNFYTKVFIDFSTISSDLALQNKKLAETNGSTYFQVPIFGSPADASIGKLFLLISGAKINKKKQHDLMVHKILNFISRDVKYIKDVQTACKLKIIQNGLGLVQYTAIAESLLRCYEQKIDTKLFIETVLLSKGMAFSPLFENYATKMIKKNQKKTASINLVYKDLSENYLKSKFFNKDIRDTDVLVNLYERTEHDKIPKTLNGMFAYAVYDSFLEKLIISNDVQGEKNLYYYNNQDVFIVSSTIDVILEYIGKQKINLDILKNYFSTRHYMPITDTLFKGIKLFKPGTINTFCLKKKNLTSKVYEDPFNWISENNYKKYDKYSEEEMLEFFDYSLKEEAKIRIPNKKSK